MHVVKAQNNVKVAAPLARRGLPRRARVAASVDRERIEGSLAPQDGERVRRIRRRGHPKVTLVAVARGGRAQLAALEQNDVGTASPAMPTSSQVYRVIGLWLVGLWS